MRPPGSGRKKGSGTYKGRLEVRVEPEVTAALDRAAGELDVDRSDLVRVYIRRGLVGDGFLTPDGRQAKARRKS